MNLLHAPELICKLLLMEIAMRPGSTRAKAASAASTAPPVLTCGNTSDPAPR